MKNDQSNSTIYVYVVTSHAICRVYVYYTEPHPHWCVLDKWGRITLSGNDWKEFYDESNAVVTARGLADEIGARYVGVFSSDAVKVHAELAASV